MDTINRRKNIEKLIYESDNPIKGSCLSEKLNVSRQVIVQDVAILRAQGVNIIATPQGYIIPKSNNSIIKTIASNHCTIDEMKDELEIIVDNGGKVIDVIVEHPIYGEIKGILNITSRRDLEEFIDKIKQTESQPISKLTNGIHFHNIEVKDNDSYEHIIDKLRQKGYLIKE
ncbi:transcription repressor NadR [Alkalithermobacter paradoxus]|uniref:Putative transcription repressor NiaR n=1 Tax=Alkalithermobacter paradoxus TaxID=29349 RepID=A0A1V4I409_9FIRM|nr:putative transcription repressor NiaR [[Clostridium] thermoalcaliphilum]